MEGVVGVATAVNALAAILLVIITRNYVIASRQSVQEMQATRREMEEARRQDIRPSFAVELYEGVDQGLIIGVTNVGRGAALDVEVQLFWELAKGGGTGGLPWFASLIQSGETRWLAAPKSTGRDSPMTLAEMPWVRLSASFKASDSLGERHEATDTIEPVIGDPAQRHRYTPAVLPGARAAEVRASLWPAAGTRPFPNP